MDLNTLYRAAFAGDTDAIIELEKKADGIQGDWTILHIESNNGNAERVRFLAREFANKNYLVKTDELGQTALHLAVEHGHIGVVEVLIDAARSLPSSAANYDDPQFKPVSAFSGFLRQANKWNNTALHRAVENCKPAIVELLARADPGDRHIQNCIGETPLYLAAKLGLNDIVKIICSVCIAPSIDGPSGLTALHAAISRFPKAWQKDSLGEYCIDTDAFRALIDAAKCSASSKDASHDSFEAILDKTTPGNMTALDLAAWENYLEVVKLILAEHPAYQPGRGRGTINHLLDLIDLVAKKGYNDMVKLLCDTYDAGRSSCNKGLTALIVAIRRRDKEFVIRLLEEDKNLVTHVDGNGWTPLHHAALNEFDSILDVIIQAQREVAYHPVSGNMVVSPLWVAASRGHTSTVIRLLQASPFSSYTDTYNGDNILHLAASLSKKEMIQYILKSCPKGHIDTILNQKNSNGNTPLHLLIHTGCFVPELIKHERVQIMTKNNDLLTALDMLYSHQDIIADQVLIKEALDDSQEANKGWKFWSRSIMHKSNTPESVVPRSTKSKKDEEFRNAKKKLIAEERKRMKEELERYRLRTNTQIVVTALITTVTFTVGFTMPGGYNQSGEPDEGLVLLSKKRAFNTFMVSDALALALSITSLFIYFISSMYEDPAQVSNLDVASTVLNIISVIAMMLTFIAGTYVVLSHSRGLAITVCIICSVFFLSIIFLLAKMMYDRHRVKKLKV